jgi:hypothetical protein
MSLPIIVVALSVLSTILVLIPTILDKDSEF